MVGRSLILLVDDDADSNASVKDYLEFDGFEVVSTHSGNEAILAANARRPDLVLLDLQLPDSPGEEVARALRGVPGMQEIAILVLSGRPADEVKQADVFAASLRKPIDPQLLSSEIRRFLP